MFREKIINRKLKIILAGVGIVVLLGAVGGGYYWWMGTPEYSISQIRKAVDTHNLNLGLKYIDTDAIFENLWADMKNKIVGGTLEADGFEAIGTMLGLQLLESMKPTLEKELSQAVESWFSAPVDEKTDDATSTEEELELGNIWQQKNFEIKKQNGSAYIELPDNIKIILAKKEGERYWIISKIEGFTENLSTAGNTEKEAEVFSNKLKEKVDLEVTSKGFISSDWERGIYSDYITINLRFINKTDKDISGVQGKIVFYDIFDNEIYRTKITYDDGIPKNESKIWKGQIEYNQFDDDDEKLRNTELENLRYEWLPDTIIYQDGNKETE